MNIYLRKEVKAMTDLPVLSGCDCDGGCCGDGCCGGGCC